MFTIFNQFTFLKNFACSKFIFIILISLGLSACSAIKQADRKAAQHTPLYPDYPFDAQVAQNALVYGKSTIKGVLFTKQKTAWGNKGLLSPRIYGSNLIVSLYPVTPYFEAWHKLRQKKETKKRAVYMSDEAFKYRIDAKTDNYGRFIFEKMKPGKYFLQAFMTTTFQYSGPSYIGTGYDQYGGAVHYYDNQNFYKNQSERLEKYIEVDKDGEIVEIKLK